MKKNFLFFFGDSFLAHEAAKKAFETARKEKLSPLSSEVLQGTVQNMAELERLAANLEEALFTPSLFQERKLLWVKNLNLFGDNPTAKAEGALPFLDKIQKALLSFNTGEAEVIVSAKSVDKRSASFKWFSSHGEAKDFSLDNETHSLESWAQEAFQEHHTHISQEALALLLSKIPTNKALLSQEIEKLATAALSHDQQIDLTLVQALASHAQEEDFFEAVDSFFALDLQRSLAAVQEYFAIHKEPRGLISALQNRGRLLLQLKVLVEAKILQPDGYSLSKGTVEQLKTHYQKQFHHYDTKSSFNLFTQNPWYLGKLLSPLRNLSLKQLFRMQEACFLYFKQSLSHPQEAQALLEQMVIRCLKLVS